ncbi:hypothetical protein [Burkholderia territorii]|uniref:hypothetical protein n=1 Tax=Burkholderia territorii TaxID=1503055 RepID=UPI00076DE7A3|nr:hypothetical protein [Burkholderia territorii]KWO60438.1 hypothetical protein WT98_30880 [Burkholderia territorii]
MSTLFVALFAKFWPAVFGVLGIAGGVLFGWLKTKSAQTAKAHAEAIVAQTQQQVEQSNAAAAEAQTQAVENASDAEQQAQATTPSSVDRQLAALDALRKK